MSRTVSCNSLIPEGNNNLNFRFVRGRVMLLETVANVCVRQRQEDDFFAVFS